MAKKNIIDTDNKYVVIIDHDFQCYADSLQKALDTSKEYLEEYGHEETAFIYKAVSAVDKKVITTSTYTVLDIK